MTPLWGILVSMIAVQARIGHGDKHPLRSWSIVWIWMGKYLSRYLAALWANENRGAKVHSAAWPSRNWMTPTGASVDLSRKEGVMLDYLLRASVYLFFNPF